jgi:DNA-binding transcriptional LysR family regulator
MSAAAVLLGGSLPTISRRVTDLETALHTELFRRNHAGVTLTEAGQTLLRHADLVADTMEAAQEEVRIATDDTGTCLHLVCCEAIALYWIAPRLADFQRDNPDIIVDLSISDSPADFHRLSGDIAIQACRPNEPDLVVSRVGRSHHAGFVSAGTRMDQTAGRSLPDLATEKALIHTPYAEHLCVSGNAFPGLGLMRRMNSMEVMVSFCQSGIAPALLPTHLAERFPELLLCRASRPPALDVWLYHTSRVRKLKNGGIFLDWLHAAFSAGESDWFRQVDITRQD